MGHEAIRKKIQNLLRETAGPTCKMVYWRPPEGYSLDFPCVVMELSAIDNVFADSIVYGQNLSYQVTVMDQDKDSVIAENISKLTMTAFHTTFISDNINHFVFTIHNN